MSDEPLTPRRPAPAPHVESGQQQFETTLRNMLREELRPLANSVMHIDAKQRTIEQMLAVRMALPLVSLSVAVVALALVVAFHM